MQMGVSIVIAIWCARLLTPSLPRRVTDKRLHQGLEKHTDTSGVDRRVPPTCIYGDYCFRASVKKHDEHNPRNLKNHYHGYSDNIGIVELTEKACHRHRKEGEACTTATLMFIRDVPCYERVVETDSNDRNPKTVYLP